MDQAGRTIQRTHLAFDGSVTTDAYVQYDLLGRPVVSWRPYTGNALPDTLPAGTPYATASYDGLNRLVNSVAPDGATTTYAYSF